MTFRKEIVTALKAALAEIRTTNCYTTDIGQKVFHWSGVLDHNEQSHIAFADTTESPTLLGNGRGYSYVLTVELQAVLFAQFIDGAQQDRGDLANDALQDLKNWVEAHMSLGLPNTTVRLGDSELSAENDGRNPAGVFLTLAISYK